MQTGQFKRENTGGSLPDETGSISSHSASTIRQSMGGRATISQKLTSDYVVDFKYCFATGAADAAATIFKGLIVISRFSATAKNATLFSLLFEASFFSLAFNAELANALKQLAVRQDAEQNSEVGLSDNVIHKKEMAILGNGLRNTAFTATAWVTSFGYAATLSQDTATRTEMMWFFLLSLPNVAITLPTMLVNQSLLIRAHYKYPSLPLMTYFSLEIAGLVANVSQNDNHYLLYATGKSAAALLGSALFFLILRERTRSELTVCGSQYKQETKLQSYYQALTTYFSAEGEEAPHSSLVQKGFLGLSSLSSWMTGLMGFIIMQPEITDEVILSIFILKAFDSYVQMPAQLNAILAKQSVLSDHAPILELAAKQHGKYYIPAAMLVPTAAVLLATATHYLTEEPNLLILSAALCGLTRTLNELLSSYLKGARDDTCFPLTVGVVGLILSAMTAICLRAYGLDNAMSTFYFASAGINVVAGTGAYAARIWHPPTTEAPAEPAAVQFVDATGDIEEGGFCCSVSACIKYWMPDPEEDQAAINPEASSSSLQSLGSLWRGGGL
jgi:hypothetical protein